jgi:hypothetical protein
MSVSINTLLCVERVVISNNKKPSELKLIINKPALSLHHPHFLSPCLPASSVCTSKFRDGAVIITRARFFRSLVSQKVGPSHLGRRSLFLLGGGGILARSSVSNKSSLIISQSPRRHHIFVSVVFSH